MYLLTLSSHAFSLGLRIPKKGRCWEDLPSTFLFSGILLNETGMKVQAFFQQTVSKYR